MRLPHFEPKVPYPGVKWELAEQQWRARIPASAGAQSSMFRVKPKDFSETELERSFQEAVAWKKRQEKEREKLRKTNG